MRDLHHRVDPSYRLFNVRGVAAAIRKAGSSTAQGPDGLTLVHLPHLGEHGLDLLTELFNLSVEEHFDRSLYSDNLEELRHNPNFEGREASRPKSLLLPHLTALPGSEDTRAALAPPVHRGGAWHMPLPARPQTETLHRFSPAPYFF